MTVRRWIGILSMVAGGMAAMSAAQVSAEARDITLGSAGALAEICTVAPSDADSAAELGFCYGFFEGAIRYHQALSGTDKKQHLVCAPAGTTRQQAVEVFVSFVQENPEYNSEAPIDTVIRSLVAHWPCDDAG